MADQRRRRRGRRPAQSNVYDIRVYVLRIKVLAGRKVVLEARAEERKAQLPFQSRTGRYDPSVAGAQELIRDVLAGPVRTNGHLGLSAAPTPTV